MEANYVQFVSPQVRILSEQQVQKLHFASLEILERTGVTVDSPIALTLLEAAGADVSDPKRVRIPAYLVEQALRTTPKSFILYRRDGSPYIRLSGTRVYFGATPDMKDVLDPATSTRRPTRIADIAATCRVVDALSHVNFLYTAGWAGYEEGIPGDLADRVSFMLTLQNTTKPFCCSIANVANLKDMLEACSIVAGGLDQLGKRPFFFGTVEPVTPLVQGKDAIEKSLLCAEVGIPNVVYSMQMGGATAPATFAGILALANAEILSHLVIIQLKKPGAPIIYGAMPNVMDMRLSNYPYGAPELSLLVGGLTELCHSYGLPMFGTAGCTDAKTIGVQTGLEVMYQCLLSSLTGANFVHDVGLMDHSNMFSPELMVLVDEVIDMLGICMAGIEITDETLALDLIDKVGPGGNYLAEKHTLDHFRSFWMPTILDRTEGASLPGGGQPMPSEQLLREKTLRLMHEHQPDPLPDAVLTELKKLEESWFTACGVDYGSRTG